MTAFNIVRFRVKPGHEEHFIAAHRGRNLGLRGFRGGTLVKTGERSYCIVGEWTSLQKLIEARDKLLPRLVSGKLSVEALDIRFPPGMAEELSSESTISAHA